MGTDHAGVVWWGGVWCMWMTSRSSLPTPSPNSSRTPSRPSGGSRPRGLPPSAATRRPSTCRWTSEPSRTVGRCPRRSTSTTSSRSGPCRTAGQPTRWRTLPSRWTTSSSRLPKSQNVAEYGGRPQLARNPHAPRHRLRGVAVGLRGHAGSPESPGFGEAGPALPRRDTRSWTGAEDP